MPRIIPIRDLKDTSTISRMCSESSEPIFITKNGYGDMVIMSMKAYEEKLWLLDTYAKLAEAEAELQAGKTSDARSALKALRARTERAQGLQGRSVEELLSEIDQIIAGAEQSEEI